MLPAKTSEYVKRRQDRTYLPEAMDLLPMIIIILVEHIVCLPPHGFYIFWDLLISKQISGARHPPNALLQ